MARDEYDVEYVSLFKTPKCSRCFDVKMKGVNTPYEPMWECPKCGRLLIERRD